MLYLCTRNFKLQISGSVVQLVRIRACHARGRGFESRPDRKREKVISPFFILVKGEKREIKMYYVYIIYSKTLDVYYKGTTEKIEKRIKEHQDGKSRYTSQARDWEMKYQREYSTKREA